MDPLSYRLDLVSTQSLSRNLLVMITPMPTSSVSTGVSRVSVYMCVYAPRFLSVCILYN